MATKGTVSGVVVFAKTSKALSRLNEIFRVGEVKKTYWAIVKNEPPFESQTLKHYIYRNEKLNKSVAYDKPKNRAKEAVIKMIVEDFINEKEQLKSAKKVKATIDK